MQASDDILASRLGNGLVVLSCHNGFRECQQLIQGLDCLLGKQITDEQDEQQSNNKQTSGQHEQLVIALQHFTLWTYQDHLPVGVRQVVGEDEAVSIAILILLVFLCEQVECVWRRTL